ncbi:MAG TPA: thioredoxin family protein [Bacteroidia bacterium]|jgi:peroxiredoxin|nr:thioredoxin family protein [Bacteroidia bacterium]
MKIKKTINLIAAAAIITLASFTEGGYKVGDKAADFKLKNTIDNKMVSMADYKDAKGIIVVFTCNHCPFAVKYESRIMNLDKKFKAKGFPVIAISPNDPTIVSDDSPENMAKLAKDKKYSFPYLFDETQETAKTYGATKTPHVYILLKEKSDYIVKYIGAIDDNADDEKVVKEKYVENAIENILAGKPVTPETTKAIGCGIKWKKV